MGWEQASGGSSISMRTSAVEMRAVAKRESRRFILGFTSSADSKSPVGLNSSCAGLNSSCFTDPERKTNQNHEVVGN